jgi:protein TonB
MALTDGRRGPRERPARPGVLVAVGPLGAAYDDPMSRVLGLDAQSSGPGAWTAYLLGALALLFLLTQSVHVFAALLALTDRAPPAAPAPSEIDVMPEEAPPPPPPPPAPEPEPQAKPEPEPPRVHHEAPPPPPAPAQAGKVLTQAPDPNEPVDLTGNTIVTGNADAYAGGTTASNGTSTTAVRGLAAPGGVPGGTGKPTAAPAAAVDRSRPPKLASDTEWSCPFPPEADSAQIDDTYVLLTVDVRADGSVSGVKVLQDPGNGFGREARRCAPSHRFEPALDRDGTPIPGTTRPLRIHFSR